MRCWGVVVLFSVLAGPAPAAAEPDLRVCSTGDYPPLTYRDPVTGVYTGIDIEMARNLATYLGRTPVYVATTWPTLTRDLDNCDIAMGGISITPARQQVGEFTIPYLDTGKIPLARRELATQLESIDQINQRGVRVIENPGGTNEQFARQHFPNADIIIWPDNATIFARLAAGEADVMITDNIEARYQAELNPDLVAVNPDRPFTIDQKAYLLPRGSGLSGEVNAWLQSALADGTFDQILHQWIG
ncbi:MAG: transporter substrate-binding domain-containing protein [Mycobacterium sp.]|nr:transporter substrate-binding domain-containing protein [Mycobacterium sp.]